MNDHPQLTLVGSWDGPGERWAGYAADQWVRFERIENPAQPRRPEFWRALEEWNVYEGHRLVLTVKRIRGRDGAILREGRTYHDTRNTANAEAFLSHLWEANKPGRKRLGERQIDRAMVAALVERAEQIKTSNPWLSWEGVGQYVNLDASTLRRYRRLLDKWRTEEG